MPIDAPFAFRRLTRQEFAELDYVVMRHAFACQRELGRLCEECIYQNDLAARLRASGVPVETEVPITVTHGAFTRTYYLDLVIAQAAIYELKVHSALAREHEAQLLNYLFLSGVDHGKLINLRPSRVETRFVNATVDAAQRHDFDTDFVRWIERDADDASYRTTILELLRDWGTRLEVGLYHDAVCHLSNGGLIDIPIVLARAGVLLGPQRFRLLKPDTTFRITAMKDGTQEYEQSLRSLMTLAALRCVQWVNLARERVQFISLVQ